jgi:DNA-binding PadR family transcriptional regulator
MPSRDDVERLLPLKPLVLEILLALVDGERHGWSLVRDMQQRPGGRRIMPGNFYRTLRRMLADGFIEESRKHAARDEDDARRRYFRMTPFGARVAAVEARRLEALVVESREKGVLSLRSRS